MIRPTDSDIGQKLIYAPLISSRPKHGELIGILEAVKPIDKRVVVAFPNGKQTVSIANVRWADKRRARADIKLQDILLYSGFAGMLIGVLATLAGIGVVSWSVPFLLEPVLLFAAYVFSGGLLAFIVAYWIAIVRGEVE